MFFKLPISHKYTLFSILFFSTSITLDISIIKLKLNYFIGNNYKYLMTENELIHINDHATTFGAIICTVCLYVLKLGIILYIFKLFIKNHNILNCFI